MVKNNKPHSKKYTPLLPKNQSAIPPINRELTQKIITVLGQKNYIPINYKALTEQLAIESPKDKKSLQHLLSTLETHGIISRIKENRYCLPKDAQLMAGSLYFKPTGSAIFKAHPPHEFSCLVLAEDTDTALHEDEVLIRTKTLSKREKRLYPNENQLGQVIRILKRKRLDINGTLQIRQNIFYIIPDDPKMPRNIIVAPTKNPLFSNATIGDKIIVRLLEWENRHMNPIGEIVAVLGQSHTPDAEYEALLHKYNLSPTFPQAIENELSLLNPTINPADHPERLDCQKLFTLTIDPTDAKDFDDALSLERLPDDKIRVGVHIADVAHYVKINTPLDLEAKKRGNSTYLVGSVIPMLPHTLSSGLCSLKENEIRLTKSIFFTFDSNYKLESHTFHHTIIKNDKRLSYEQAIAFLQTDNLKTLHALPTPPAHQTGYAGTPLTDLSDDFLLKIQSTLRTLWQIASHLRKQRFQKGSLDLEMPEVKIYTNPEGYADRIERIQYDESHQLIEEFMLLANETIAKALFDHKIPFLSRVHDTPDSDKLDEYREYLNLFGISVGDLSQRESVIKALNAFKTHPQAHILKLEFLKSLKRACYRPKIDGHYGLNKTYYTHFTSPIRRYTDLTIHRLFDSCIPYASEKKGFKQPKHLPYSQQALIPLGEQLSLTEFTSTEAERESKRIKLLEYFENETHKQKRTPLDGIIVDIKSMGLFIELTESLAFGLIHLSDLKDDLYQINRTQTVLIGRKYKKRYTIGDKIQVYVHRVNRFKRQIDFISAP